MASTNATNSPVWNVDSDNSVIVSDSTIQQSNDSYVLAFRDAGDTQYYNIMKLNAADQLLIESGQLGTNRQFIVGEDLGLGGGIFGQAFCSQSFADTSSGSSMWSYAKTSSGTPIAGFGVGSNYYADNASNILKFIGGVFARYQDPTNGAEDTQVDLSYLVNSVSASTIFDGSGMSQDGGTSYFNWNGGVQSYTPTVSGDGTAGSGSYTAQGGWVLQLGQIGNGVVWCGGVVTWSAHTGTGNLVVDLPVAVRSGANTQMIGSVSLSNYTYTAGATPVLSSVPGSATAALAEITPGSARANLALDTSADLRFSIMYAI